MNKKIVNWMDKKFYSKFENNWDDTMFREHILKEVNATMIVLDVGAGAGIVDAMNFKGYCKEIYGIDPDERVVDNKFLTKGYVGLADSMPFFEDEKFDLIICDNVLEHVDNPNSFLKEVNRVLKVGGVFMGKTPNKYHYMPLIAKFTPTWFHKFYNKLRGRESEDTFPTRYLLNSITEQTNIFSQNGFSISYIKSVEARPEYLRITFLSYFFGIVYERIVNTLNINILKILLISKFKKQ